MKQNEIIEIAIQAGAAKFYPEAQSVKEDNYLVGQKFLETFAKLVAKAEREKCAKICGEYNFAQAPKMIQDAIRARGQK